MAPTSVTLVDGSTSMVLLPRQDDSVWLGALDVPSPGMREVSEPRADDDGEDDTTSKHGSRGATVELLVGANPRAIEDELAAFLQPDARPYLVVEDDEWTLARRLRLRVDQWSAPLTADLPSNIRKIQAQWKCPDGIWEAAEEVLVPDLSADIPSHIGLTFPVTFPATFAGTLATGAYTVNNPGTRPAWFTVRMYGPCTAPSLVNETTGEEITFTSSLVLGAGDYVDVNVRDRSAYLLSDTSQSLLGYVDFAATTWWRLARGDQSLRYAPASASAGAVAQIIYRPAWL